MKKLFLTLGLLSVLSASAGHTGRVFVDTNRNGMFDKGEKCLSGVAVSDGRHVVKTDRNGAFELPGHDRERFIFITTPSGFKTDNNYYRRIGSEGTEYNFGVVPYAAHIASDGKPIMVFNHDLVSHNDEFKFYNSKKEFVDLDARNLKAWIYGHWHINHIIKHKHAYSVCTSTLMGGGIDHASSAFRIFDVDARGDFRTELRYNNWDKKIEIASLDNLQAEVSPSGQLPVSVNTYSTVSPTTQVTCDCHIEDRQVLRNRALRQNTNMNWSGTIQLPEEAHGKLVTITATATYRNGEVSKTSHSFIYQDTRAAEINVAGKTWDNLRGSARHAEPSDKVELLKLKWTTNVGGNIYMVSPVLSQGRLFEATVDENLNGEASVAALDARSGALLWKSEVEGSIKNTIALAADKVFAQDIYGNLYAFGLHTDGEVTEQTETSVEVLQTMAAQVERMGVDDLNDRDIAFTVFLHHHLIVASDLAHRLRIVVAGDVDFQPHTILHLVALLLHHPHTALPRTTGVATLAPVENRHRQTGIDRIVGVHVGLEIIARQGVAAVHPTDRRGRYCASAIRAAERLISILFCAISISGRRSRRCRCSPP